MPSVWILNHYAALPSEAGGTRHIELARRLVSRGFDVTLISSAFRHASRTLADTQGRAFIVVDHEGVRIVRLRSRTRYAANGGARILNMIEFAVRAWWAGRSRFRGAAPRPDVIVGSSPHLLTPLAAQRLARRFRVPFLFEVRDLWPETFVALGLFGRGHPVVRLLRRLERRLYRRADRIITLLPEAWRYICEAGVRREDIVWIPNGAAVPEVTEGMKDTRAAAQLTVMYVGAHGRANAIEELLTAAQIVERGDRRVRFVLVGDGPVKATLVQQTKRLGLQNLEFRDPVPKHHVPALSREADILVALLEDSALYQYGISLNKLFDYMAAGKPVILAGRVAFDYVEKAQCGITVPPRDANALAQAIGELADLPEAARRAMGERGRAYAREHHDWNTLAERVASALREAAGI